MVTEKLTLSVPEAAEAIGVAPLSLYLAIQRGEFKQYIRIGRRILIPVKALDELLATAGKKEG